MVFWNWIEKEDDNGDKKKIPFLRYYTVFNVAQCDGLKVPATEERPAFNPIEAAAAIVENMPKRPAIDHGKSGAYYDPSSDKIGLPSPETFKTPTGYYATAFHELAHSTGHASRLGRCTGSKAMAAFGSEEYSKEELVAEMGAAFLCGEAGIENDEIKNSAAYIKGWMKALKKDSTLLVKAGGQAQKAADFILDATRVEG